MVAQVNGAPFPVGSGAGDEFIKDVIASGPYTLESYTPGSSIKLVRNEHWDQDTDDVRKAYPDAGSSTIGLEGATIDERLIAGQGADVNAISGNDPARHAGAHPDSRSFRSGRSAPTPTASPTWAWTPPRRRSTSSKCARR